MSVTVTLTFPNMAEAAAFLGGAKPAQAAAPAPEGNVKAAASQPAATPSAVPAAAPSPAPTPAAASEPLDFDKHVIGPMKEYSKKVSREAFITYLKNLGVAKPADLKDKPDTWQKAIDAMKA
jgi:hypothetical protein